MTSSLRYLESVSQGRLFDVNIWCIGEGKQNN